MEVHHTGNPLTYLEVKRTKHKVTRPINTETESVFRMKAYEVQSNLVQMKHEDPCHRQAPWPPRSKVKVTRSLGASDTCWPIIRERKVPETSKLVGRLRTPWHVKRICFKVKRSKVMVTRPTNADRLVELPIWKAYELQTLYTDGARTPVLSTTDKRRDLQGQTSTSQGHEMGLTRVGLKVDRQRKASV